jgi:hypothetical protein
MGKPVLNTEKITLIYCMFLFIKEGALVRPVLDIFMDPLEFHTY